MGLEIHPVQANILRVLLFKPKARFSELNVAHLSTDHFTFHVKRLVEVGLIEKKEGEAYQLTIVGKEFANRFDTESVTLERQAKVGVLITGVKKEKGVYKYLVQQRLKQPYYGHYGFLTGKVKWGETVWETAARELEEETGLSGKLILVGVKHKMDYSKKEKLLEDKYFFVFRAANLKGKLIRTFQGGKNQWLTRGEITKLPDLFDGVDETIEMVNQNKFVFSETKYTVSSY